MAINLNIFSHRSRPRRLTKIVVIGLGAGGLAATMRLASRFGREGGIRLTAIDKQSTHYLKHWLYTDLCPVKATDGERGEALRKILSDRPVELIHDRVVAIEPTTRRITLHQGNELIYDYLLIATGSRPDYQSIKGLAEFSLSLESPSAVERIVNRLRDRKDPIKRIVIGGGGPTGVELAAHLANWPHITVDLIERSSRLLSGLPASASELVQKYLKLKGVECYLNQTIGHVDSDKVYLTGRRSIPYDLLIWAGGRRATTLLAEAKLPVDELGRVRVNRYLQVKGCSRVFAVGDAAALEISANRHLPMLASHAVDEAVIAADNIAAVIARRSLRIYHPVEKATVISLNHDYAVLNHGPWLIAGRAAAIARRIFDFWYASGWRRLR